jgi:hypothetical protein
MKRGIRKHLKEGLGYHSCLAEGTSQALEHNNPKTKSMGRNAIPKPFQN